MNYKHDEGELAGSRVEPLFASLIKTYYKLRELGFTEVNGNVVFHDNTEVKP